MKLILITTLFGLLCLASCRNNSHEYGGTDDYQSTEQLRGSLEDRESNAPLSYVSYDDCRLTPNVVETRKGGLFRDPEYGYDGGTIEGYLVNSASVAKFKDATVKVRFLSKTGSVIDQQSYTIYEYLEPGKRLYFTKYWLCTGRI